MFFGSLVGDRINCPGRSETYIEIDYLAASEWTSFFKSVRSLAIVNFKCKSKEYGYILSTTSDQQSCSRCSLCVNAKFTCYALVGYNGRRVYDKSKKKNSFYGQK